MNFKWFIWYLKLLQVLLINVLLEKMLMLQINYNKVY